MYFDFVISFHGEPLEVNRPIHTDDYSIRCLLVLLPKTRAKPMARRPSNLDLVLTTRHRPNHRRMIETLSAARCAHPTGVRLAAVRSELRLIQRDRQSHVPAAQTQLLHVLFQVLRSCLLLPAP